MPDRKEPHLRIPEASDDVNSAKPKAAPQAAAGGLNRKASEAARAEVRRRLAEKNAAQADDAVKTAASKLPPEQSAASTAQASHSGGGGGSRGSLPPQVASSRRFPWTAALALIVAAAGLAFGGWQYQRAEAQQATLEKLGERLQEVEIRLSETGQDLTEAGSTFSEKLDWADSEIRKLWVVAHQRNRPAISELQEKTTGLERRLATAEQAAEQANQEVSQVSNQLDQQLAGWEEQQTALQAEIESYSQRLSEISLTTSTLGQQLRDQDRREQVAELEDELTRLAGRLNALSEEQVDQLPDDLDERLAEQEEILASLEASRRQLTSRVTRLMDEVRELQQGR